MTTRIVISSPDIHGMRAIVVKVMNASDTVAEVTEIHPGQTGEFHVHADQFIMVEEQAEKTDEKPEKAKQAADTPDVPVVPEVPGDDPVPETPITEPVPDETAMTSAAPNVVKPVKPVKSASKTAVVKK